MKVLITGIQGQLGYDVAKVLDARKIEYYAPALEELDITNRAVVLEILEKYHPDAVVHCAAYTAVDKAEDEPEKCWAVNVDGTRNIAEGCKKIGAKLLYISTDYVFEGTGEQFYKETDPVNPQNVYGASKLAGELVVKSFLEKYFIVRTSWVFGENGNNFIKTMLQLAETKTEISVVCDQIGSPTYTADLALLLCDMVATEKYGIYHATNEGTCSWAEFAEEIFRVAGKKVTVRPVTSEEYPTKAKRPGNSRLGKESLERMAFSYLPTWKDALERYLEEL
jgi:dTDP-4-dehydrorhamnose reductase